MDTIKKFCCCTGEEDGGIPYAPFVDEDDITHPVRPNAMPRSRSANHGRFTVSSAYDETDNGAMVPSVQEGPPKTAAELRAERLQQIVQDTQENIIDVAHLTCNQIGTHDYIERARDYEDNVLNHDARVSKTKPTKTVTHKKVLDDCGNKAADWLGRPAPAQLYKHALDSARKMVAAVEQVQIEHKTDLVVHMDL